MTGVPDLAAWLREQVGADLGDARRDLELARRPGYYGCQDSLCEEAAALERVARCEAELGILDEHAAVWRDIGFGTADGEEYEEIPVCGLCVPKHSHYRSRDLVPEGPCRTVRLLGSGYRARDGYREEWAP